MTRILTLINLILLGILVYILVYPQIKARQEVEATVVYQQTPGALPLFVAEKLGLFDSVKVKVTAEEALLGPEVVDDVGKGKYQMLYGVDWANALFRMSARPEAYRVAFSANYSQSNPYASLVTLRKSRIRTLKDLLLKRIGYPKGTRYNMVLKHYLKQEGLDPDKVSFIGLLPSEMTTALDRNYADALLVVEPYRSIVVRREDVRVLEDAVFTRRVVSPLPVFVGLTSIVNLNLTKAQVQRVYQATEQAIRYIRQFPDSAAQILRERFNLPEDAPVNLPQFETYQEIDPTRLEAVIAHLKEAEVLFVDIDPNDFMMSPSDLK